MSFLNKIKNRAIKYEEVKKPAIITSQNKPTVSTIDASKVSTKTIEIPIPVEELPTLDEVLAKSDEDSIEFKSCTQEVVEVMNKLEELKATSSKKEKEAIIDKYKNDVMFMKVLKFLCNDMIVTGLSKNKISKVIAALPEVMTQDLSLAMRYLINHNTGRDEDIAWIQCFIRVQDKCCYDFLTELFTKSYKCGITSKTLNKVVAGSVPEFGVMLAESYFKYKKDKDGNRIKYIYVDLKGKRFILTEKLDGMRCVLIKNGDSISFYSRQGQPIEGLIEIIKEAKELPDGVYDGELIADGIFAESKDQYKATMKIARKKGDKTGLKLVCFDYIESIDDFLKGYCETEFEERKSKLYDILRVTPEIETPDEKVELDRYTKIKYLDNLYIGDDPEEIAAYFETVVTLGGEGLMINLANAPYETKRTKTLLKYKQFYNADLRVKGVYEGTNSNVGKLGGIYVNYKGYTDKVGSGFTQEERELYYNTPEEIIGKIVDIQYFEESTNQDNDDISMRFATFKGIRTDKAEESYEI